MMIDVVIPTYNRLWSLKRVLPDYLRRPEINLLIVVDDASNDGTQEWLGIQGETEPRLLVLHHESRRGACAARNTGADKTQAPYVFFADDDMLLYPEQALTLLVKDLTKAEADIIAPVLIFPEGQQPARLPLQRMETPDALHLYRRLTLERKPMKTLISRMPDASFPSAQLPGLMLMRRNVLREVRYNELLGDNSYRDETDFQFTAIEKGFHLLACPTVYLIDLFEPNDKGGCHNLNHLEYELLCCRNNWRILKVHRETLKEIGVTMPIQIMQFCFIAEHILNRLTRKYFYEFRRHFGFLR
jgi:glycosyltransferase involved in cell wall biosynthesis